MRKQDFIKMVMENPAPVMGMLACYGGHGKGYGQIQYTGRWEFVGGQGNFEVTDEFVKETIWNKRGEIKRIYTFIPVKKHSLKQFALNEVVGLTEEDQKKIEELYKDGLLVDEFGQILTYDYKTVANANFTDEVTFESLPVTWNETDENGEFLPWGKAFKGTREDYIKHMKEKMGNVMIFDTLEEE